jgi:hypothetical protein
MNKAQTAALQDIATGRDAKLTRRSPKTVASLVEAGAIRSTSGIDWHFELTEYGQSLVSGI